MFKKQFRHEFASYGGQQSECRVRLFETIGGLTLVIADQLPGHHSAPLSQVSAHLATQLYRLYFPPNGTQIDEFVYIEHAPANNGAIEYSLTRVDFDWDDEGMQFLNAQRTSISAEEVRELTGDETAA